MGANCGKDLAIKDYMNQSDEENFSNAMSKSYDKFKDGIFKSLYKNLTNVKVYCISEQRDCYGRRLYYCEYKPNEYDWFYIYNEKFEEAVDNFIYMEGCFTNYHNGIEEFKNLYLFVMFSPKLPKQKFWMSYSLKPLITFDTLKFDKTLYIAYKTITDPVWTNSRRINHLDIDNAIFLSF